MSEIRSVHEVVRVLGEDQYNFAELVENWTQFAYALDINRVKILKIKKSKEVGLSDVPGELISIWKASAGKKATYKTLHQALIESENIALAEKIRERFAHMFEDAVKVDINGEIVSLEKFLGKDESSAVYQEISNKIGKFSKDPIKLLQDKLVLVEKLTYYIPRTLSLRSKLNQEVFTDSSTRDSIFLVKGVSVQELDGLVNGANIDSVLNQDNKITARFLLSKGVEDFRRIVPKTTKVVHYTEYKNNSYYWIRSSNDLSTIQRFMLPSTERISEDELLKHIFKLDPPCIFSFSDSPGMGKTALLRNLFINVQGAKHGGPRILLFIVLNELTQTITEEINSEYAAISALAHYAGTNNVSSCIIKKAFEFGRYTFDLFLDGYDEVHQDKLATVDKFLKNIKRVRNVRIFVTTRPHLRGQLDNILGVMSYEILEFDESNQISFMKKYWVQEHQANDDIRLERFAKKCLDALKEQITDSGRLIAGIPLQCKMLADVYEGDAKDWLDLNEERHFVVRVRSIFEMYEQLVALKFSRLSFNKISNKKESNQLMERERLYRKQHVYQAISLLFPDYTERMKQYWTDFDNIKATDDTTYRIGLIEESPFLQYPRFVHRTYAEYLLAEFLVRHITKKTVCMDILFSNILCGNGVAQKAEHQIFDRPYIYVFRYPAINYFIENHLSKLQTDEKVDFDLIALYLKSLAFEFDIVESMLMALAACCFHNMENCFDFIENIIRRFDFNDKKWRDLADTCLKHLPHLAAEYSNNHTLLQKTFDLSKDLLNVWKDFHTFTPVVNRSTNTRDHAIQHELMYPWIAGCTPLHIAVHQNDACKVLKILRLYGDEVQHIHHVLHVCLNNTDGLTGAELSTKTDIIKLLVAKNKNWIHEKYSESSHPPILEKNVHIELIQLLSSNGAEVNTYSPKHGTLLHTVESENALLERLNWAMSKGFNLINAQNSKGFTALHRAIETFGVLQDSTINLFKKYEANFNCQDDLGNPIFFSAIKTGNICFILKILHLVSDVNTTNKKGENAAHIAIQYSKEPTSTVRILELLHKNGFWTLEKANKDGNTPFFYTFIHQKQSFDLHAHFIRKNVNINFQNHDGDTALFHALQTTHEGHLIHHILESGADVNHKNNNGENAAHIFLRQAIAKTFSISILIDVLELLLSKGFTKMSNTDKNNICPLMLVLQIHEVDYRLLDFLKENGADFNGEDFEGNSVLFAAIENRQPKEILEKIIQLNGDPCHRNSKQQNALHIAALHASASAAELLVKSLDPNTKDSNGNTPLHLLSFSRKRNTGKIFDILVSNGAKPQERNNDGLAVLVKWIKDGLRSFDGLTDERYRVLIRGKGIASQALTALLAQKSIVEEHLQPLGNDISKIESFVKFYGFLEENGGRFMLKDGKEFTWLEHDAKKVQNLERIVLTVELLEQLKQNFSCVQSASLNIRYLSLEFVQKYSIPVEKLFRCLLAAKYYVGFLQLLDDVLY